MIPEQKLAVLERRIKAFEDRLDKIDVLEKRLDQLAAAHTDTREKIPDLSGLRSDMVKLRDAIQQVGNKVSEVENRIPELRKEMERYHRESNMGIMASVVVLLVLILVAGFLSP